MAGTQPLPDHRPTETQAPVDDAIRTDAVAIGTRDNFDSGLAALIRLLARQAAREHCGDEALESF